MIALYEDILAIARNYMGPAAEDYIRRRIRIVQGGAAPESISVDKLDRLAAGIQMTAKVYMGEERGDRFQREVLELRKKYG